MAQEFGISITQEGFAVNLEKLSSIHCSKTLRTSFYPTCSWFRRYIENYADKSHLLSVKQRGKRATIKSISNAQKLSPFLLKQTDDTKPHDHYTKASNYALKER
ncbi:hypothetical protein NPIL_145241 [Nephila pilipes]|uniref:Uncharacterized protein n=1 Tax=Nephila pilipes TaxID=299642 RepID=A0A8X6UAQ4_NEPPI|nr:hypothetical protein NPIL_145241 [Nephila pilipes]